MQGYSHALTGAAGWLAISSAATLNVDTLTGGDSGISIPLSANLLHAPGEVALAGAIICAGAAIAPDADHHSGTIAHSLPPISGPMCEGIEHISGGHRHATHSLVGIAVFALVAWGASLVVAEIEGRTVALGAGIIAVLMTAFAIKALKLRLGRRDSVLGTFLGPWIVSLGTAGIATYLLDYTWTWLPVAMALGTFIHCVGDSLTTQGVPWLWPLNPKPPKSLMKAPLIGNIVRIVWQRNGYFRVPLLGDTNSIREAVFGVLVGVYILASVLAIVVAMA